MTVEGIKAREVQIRQKLPELFDGTYKSVLYVGANQKRQHFLPEFALGYEKVTVLEIYPENAEFLAGRYTGANVQIIQGDVRDAARLVPDKHDVCFFWHGPEHLRQDETAAVLERLESLATSLIILGMPYGHYEQGAEYGNRHETHQWDIYPSDMEKLGYLTATIGEPGDRMGNILAWKHL